MSINKDSLILRLGLFFLLVLFFINILLFLENEYYKKQEDNNTFERYLRIMHLMRDSIFDSNLTMFELERSNITPKYLKANATVINSKPFVIMYRYKGELFFQGCKPPRPISPHHDVFHERVLPSYKLFQTKNGSFKKEPQCIVFKSLEKRKTRPLWLIMSIVNIVLFFFFVYFIRKLMPLYYLEEAISNLDDYSESKPVKFLGNNEVGKIARAYNNVRTRMLNMKEARTLFLRNILHELNTPFMKGKLLSKKIEDPTLMQHFDTLFDRMEFVLGELKQIEKLSSGDWKLGLIKKTGS